MKPHQVRLKRPSNRLWQAWLDSMRVAWADVAYCLLQVPQITMWHVFQCNPPQARLGPPEQRCAAACESSPTTAAPRCTVLPADLPDLMSSCNGPTCMSAVLCAVSCHPAACRTPSQNGSGPPYGPCRRPSAAACSRRGRPAHRHARLQPAQRPRRPHLPRSPGHAGCPVPAAAASMQRLVRKISCVRPGSA
jgi:hypothetical protein